MIIKQSEFYKLLESETVEERLDDEPTKQSKSDENEDPLEDDFVVVKIESIDESYEEDLEVPVLEITQNDDECSQLFDSSKQNIAEHVKESHASKPKRYNCNHCSYNASKPIRLESHCLRYHNTSPPKTERRKQKVKVEMKKRKQCPECGILVKNLSEHQKIIHHQLKRFCCDFCNYSCYFKTKITRHLQRHIPKHLREQFPCDECNFVATRKDALKSHVLTMHQKAREKTCLCIECGKSFYNRSQLNIHNKSVHEKVRNHLCNLCGKSFFNSKDLDMHNSRHGEKNLACEVCGNLFYCNLDLRRHLKIHSDPTISCELCNKKFYTNSKLKMHVKIRHEGAKDYFCDYCSSRFLQTYISVNESSLNYFFVFSFRFSQYNNLKRHVNSVHKSLKINCLVPGCNYSVARKDKYKNHLASQHKFLDEKTKETILKSVKFE